ncbi:BTAD domain-containing putative transcriptional regulator [Actinoplanes sp. NPDC051851]|uniref:AfsR/SARP family transcriptional regulator n=1 Tax=Actinoplanes sp. NPDC051851 TaxID=3154753 RepID=UPI003418222C
MSSSYDFRLLGPLTVRAAGRLLPITATRQKTVLTLLLLNAGHVVSMEQIAEAVWEENLPRRPANQIAICVSSLRRALTTAGAPRDLLQTVSPGYMIDVGAESLDIHRVDILHARARRVTAERDVLAARANLRAALAEWRGPVLAGLTSRLFQPDIARWEERRLSVLEECVDLELELGACRELIGELSAVVTSHPLRERPRWQLMLALYRSGRKADALALYQNTRQVLEQELGLDPGVELQELNEEILRGTVAPPASFGTASPTTTAPGLGTGEAVPARPWGDSTITAAPEATAEPRPDTLTTPRMLPARSPYFTGRAAQMDTILNHLAERSPAETATVRIHVVSGPGGVGKTSLAVNTAHQLRAAFPDGQFFTSLSGTDSRPAKPVEVLAAFLRELGVDNAAMPDDLEQRAAMYRSMLAGRRMLVVLDNAADEMQVQPLLPGSQSCAVLLTSRRRMTGIDGARLMELDVMAEPEVIELIRRIVGPERVDAEPEAVAELGRSCGHLPLAVRIVCARLAARRHQSLDKFVQRLRNKNRRLDELAHGSLDVRASISLSYRSLKEPAQLLFRRLGLTDAPDFAPWVGASLTEIDLADSEDLFELLVDAQLLEFVRQDDIGQPRYRFHDLVRLYARERADVDDTEEDRRGAIRRLLATWLALVEGAHVSLLGGNYAVVHGSVPRRAPDSTVFDALTVDPGVWYETERRGIVTAVQQAADFGLSEHCWDLAVSAVSLFGVRSDYDGWRSTHLVALAAARAAGDGRGEAMVLTGLGDLYVTQHRYAEARGHLAAALEAFSTLQDWHGYGVALRKAAYADWISGDVAVALGRYQQARTLLRDAGDHGAEAHVVRWMGQIYLEEGHLDLAQAHLTQALEISTGSRRGYAQALYRVGELALAQGELRRAEHTFTEVLTIVSDMGDRRGCAYAWHGLGLARLRQGRTGDAAPLLHRAREEAALIGDRLIELPALLALSEYWQAVGRPDEARQELAHGMHLCEQIAAPLWMARCRDALLRITACPETESGLHGSVSIG